MIAERIERLCRKILGDRLQVFRNVDHLELAVREAESGFYDLFLLDLNLSGEDGFELLKQSTSYSSQTIIISANKDRAIDAFDFGVIDFVCKPFNEERLKQALNRLDDATASASYRTAKFISFRTAGRIDVRGLDSVEYIEGADKYAEVHFKNGETRLHDKSLAQLELILPPCFERVHKSYIVRLDSIKSFETMEGSRYFARLENGQSLPISRSRYKPLRARFD